MMDASTATEPTSAAERAANGAAGTRNVGRIEEIQGVVIEAVFPERLPEINHAITVARPAAAAEEEPPGHQLRAPAASVLVCEVQQHLGDDRVRAVAMDTTDGLARGAEVIDTGGPITVPVGEVTLGRIFNLLGEPIDQGPELPEGVERRGIHQDAPSVEDLTPTTEMFETGIKVDRPARALREGRQGRPVRRRRRRQDRAHPGAHPQPRQGARRPVGVLRRGRALARGQRPLARDEGVGRAREDDARVRADERAPGGAHARRAVGPDDGRILPRPGPGRAAVHRQHLPLRAGRLRGLGAARAHALAGRLPAHAGDRDGPAAGAHHLDARGLGHLGAGDLRARRRPHRPGAGVRVRPPQRDHGALARDLRERHLPGGRPARLDLDDPQGGHRSARTTSAWPTASRRSSSATRSCRTSSRSSASTSSPTRTSSRSSARAGSSASSRSRSSSPKNSPARRARTCRSRRRSGASRRSSRASTTSSPRARSS